MLASELPKLLTEPTKIFLENQNFVIFEEVVDNFGRFDNDIDM
jgi:hypothetical protein